MMLRQPLLLHDLFNLTLFGLDILELSKELRNHLIRVLELRLAILGLIEFNEWINRRAKQGVDLGIFLKL